MSSIFIIIYIVWFASEVLLNKIKRSDSGDQKNKDRGSIILIWGTIILCITVGVILATRIQATISNFRFFPYMGLALIVAGMIFRFAAIISLGRFFTVDVTIREGHTVKKEGLYKYIRHPSYLGSILSFLGLGISINNWISLIIILVAVTTAFIYRIKIEEKVLIIEFGEEYLGYIEKSYRLIPFVY